MIANSKLTGNGSIPRESGGLPWSTSPHPADITRQPEDKGLSRMLGTAGERIIRTLRPDGTFESPEATCARLLTRHRADESGANSRGVALAPSNPGQAAANRPGLSGTRCFRRLKGWSV